MLENKELGIIKKEIEKLIQDEKIILDKKDKNQFTDFFLKNSINSFDCAKVLMNLSDNSDLKQQFGIMNFDGYLWVINASYYSMFYMVRALLESSGIKLKTDKSTQSIHLLTFKTFVYYFYLNKKLEFKLIQALKEASEEASEILGKEKAKKLIEEYESEKEKRSTFTYNLGQIAIKSKAETSFNRAKLFNEEIRKLINL